uniref:U5-Nephitoxin-Nsp1a_2 n=1 Tax=Nephila sp. SGP-2016 TaxID=1905176 RepID=A0A4Q8K8U8_9ARAC
MASTVSVFCLVTCLLLLSTPVFCQFGFAKQAAQGARDMWKAYTDMREANYIGADKYFHARGNYDAAQRGPGGKWVAGVISDAREAFQGSHTADSKADQAANQWGRNGGDPNKYRPAGLPDKY